MGTNNKWNNLEIPSYEGLEKDRNSHRSRKAHGYFKYNTDSQKSKRGKNANEDRKRKGVSY